MAEPIPAPAEASQASQAPEQPASSAEPGAESHSSSEDGGSSDYEAPEPRFTDAQWGAKYKEMMQRHDASQKRLDSIREADLLQACGEHKKISKSRADELCTKLYELHKRVQDETEKKRREQEEELVSSFSFRPDVGARSKKLRRGRADLFEWQVQHNKRLSDERERQAREEEARVAALPFRPHINEESQRLARSWAREGPVTERLTSFEVRARHKGRQASVRPVVSADVAELRDAPRIGERSARFQPHGPVHDRLYSEGKASVVRRNAAFAQRWKEQLRIDAPPRYRVSTFSSLAASM
eukprot:m51a1_g10650 hypothetical protein (299) ;mRNA; r:43842-44872